MSVGQYMSGRDDRGADFGQKFAESKLQKRQDRQLARGQFDSDAADWRPPLAPSLPSQNRIVPLQNRIAPSQSPIALEGGEEPPRISFNNPPPMLLGWDGE